MVFVPPHHVKAQGCCCHVAGAGDSLARTEHTRCWLVAGVGTNQSAPPQHRDAKKGIWRKA